MVHHHTPNNDDGVAQSTIHIRIEDVRIHETGQLRMYGCLKRANPSPRRVRRESNRIGATGVRRIPTSREKVDREISAVGEGELTKERVIKGPGVTPGFLVGRLYVAARH
jgi:hypothetical protein